jgi:chromosome partitioning protein
MARIISIINEKGGSGKTTTAVSLSAFLTKNGKRVLLCDLDPQGNATTSLGFDAQHLSLSLYHALSQQVSLKDTIKHTSLFNFDLIPASTDLAGSNIELLDKENRESILTNILSPLKESYDFILLDPPPSLGILTINALVAANEIIVPIQCEFFALKSLDELFEIFELLKRNLNKEFSQVLGLLTMYDKRNVLSREIAKEAEKKFPGKMLETVIPRSVRLAEAPKYGKTILQYAPESKGAKAYEMLAEEIINFKISNV